MQKLVSKNPVLRFKLGKKIPKAQNGIWDTVKNYGKKALDYGSTATAFLAGGPYYGTVAYGTKEGMMKPAYNYGKELIKKAYNSAKDWVLLTPDGAYLFGEKSPLLSTNLYSTPTLKKKSVTGPGSTKSGMETAAKLSSYLTDKINKLLNKTTTNLQRQSNIKRRSGWSYGYDRSNEISDIKTIQRMLKDAGFDIGKYGVDGKWGKDTENAYKLYLALKNVPMYERTPEQIIDINSPSKVLNSTIIDQEPITSKQLTEQNIVNNNLQTASNPFIPEQKVFARNGNYNRSQIRDYMKLMGLNPYDFTGNLRKALRLWLNGLSDDNSLLTGELRNLFVTPYGYKQGGQLVSRNPITRFKNKKK